LHKEHNTSELEIYHLMVMKLRHYYC